jgi:single-strand DNA-binding protein
MNKVTLIGRLTKDPELKFTPGSGNAVANFTLAVDRRFTKDGQKEADFIPVVVWGKQAESTATYVSKGKLIGVAGRIQVRSYDAKDGTKRYVTEVIADEVQFLEFGNKAPDSIEDFSDLQPVDTGDIPF